MAYVDFISPLHTATKRDYLARVNDPEYPKAKAAELALKWDVEYWEGARRTGYGGMKYDGRWRKVADLMVEHYGLKAGDRVLDVGCGKGFLLHDLTQAVPGLEVVGLDVSSYAIEHALPEIKDRLVVGHANKLPFDDASFDFVYSINTLHVLPCFDLDRALRELMRVGKQHRYLCVESWRNESEKANLLYWQLTCRAFFAPDEWEWWFEQTGYTGDHSFIYFE
ncbi:MAG: class I SAM-dependent methyltransferase [Chthoniobacterales bacterium]